MSNLIPKLRRLRYAVESSGLSRTLLDVAGHALNSVGQRLSYQAEHDHAFDQRFGTNTAGKVATSELGIADQQRQEQAILYLPSPEPVTRWMLDHVGLDHSACSFVDLGCGKGRVVLVAAQYPFRRVLGVDISRELSEIARRNVESFPARARRCADIQILNGDATTVDFPDTDLLLHLYHPFGSEVTAGVLRQLEASIGKRPRRVTVAYLLYTGAVPEVREVFARFPWLKETRYEPSLLGHYDWLFFSG